MEIAEYRNIYENEGTHFFYVGNRNLVLSLAARYLAKSKNTVKILDAGCGTGLLARNLERYGDVVAVDISPYAVKLARKRGVRIRQASVDKLPFKDSSFDLVTSVDVIYHKAVNDKRALGEFFRVLQPGGILILRVPANKWLGTLHDKHVHTRERYSKENLKKKLENAGFIIEKISFVNLSLVPLVLGRRLWEGITRPAASTSAVGKFPRILNSLLSFLLSLEARFLLAGNLPLGIGLVAVCRKPRATR